MEGDGRGRSAGEYGTSSECKLKECYVENKTYNLEKHHEDIHYSYSCTQKTITAHNGKVLKCLQ